jgi:hypothetical protein
MINWVSNVWVSNCIMEDDGTWLSFYIRNWKVAAVISICNLWSCSYHSAMPSGFGRGGFQLIISFCFSNSNRSVLVAAFRVAFLHGNQTLRESSLYRILGLSGSKICKVRELDRHILLLECGVGAPLLEAMETDATFSQGSIHIIFLGLAITWVLSG